MTFPARPLPPETIDGLTPPFPDLTYFEHAGAFPFRPGAREYSPVNSWWLAEASLMVYEPGRGPFDRSPLPGLGYELEWLGTAEENRGFLLRREDALIVVFRGTRVEVHKIEDLAEIAMLRQDDLWIDGQFLPAVHRAGGHVHRGFLTAFAEVSDRLDAILAGRRPGQPVWLTGHSLGGALAVLAAAHLGTEAIQGLYTFGAPRVGDAAFTALLPKEGNYRLVHRDDWVPLAPPEFLGYVHAGTCYSVPGSPPRDAWGDFVTGTSELASALSTMAKEGRLLTGGLPFKLSGIADHMPIYYATLLWNALL